MHRLAATPGGYNPNSAGVIFVEQTPASIIILTAADTDILTLANCVSNLPLDFPTLRVVNFLQLQQQLSIDTYAEQVLSQAQVIILRLLGGKSYWSYGLEVVKDIVAETGSILFCLPGDDQPDAELITHSTISLVSVNQLWRYFSEGGQENWLNALKFVTNLCLHTSYNFDLPKIVPRLGFYPYQSHQSSPRYPVGILFYRAHYLSGNISFIEAICQALDSHNLTPIPIFIASLQEPDIQGQLLSYLQNNPLDLLINTTSFSLNSKYGDLWQKINVPILQVILSSSTLESWENSWQGLTPRDVAMNIVLPEVDGKIITRAISFKSIKNWNSTLETDLVVYETKSDRLHFITNLATNYIRLKTTPRQHKKIALILANYPNRDGRIANGVGLDTPASCVEILKALQISGYDINQIPSDGNELISWLTAGVTNDLENQDLRLVRQSLSTQDYLEYFTTLPESIQTAINQRWGTINSETNFSIAGIQLGNIFIGIQPSRGYDIDPSLNYHAPDLEPTHQYLAFYYWLRKDFNALAIVHIGKHGNLEWLPGKSIALSAQCYPEIAFGAIPHFYPFIVNDPGEGAQAKRRSHAVIIDHLTPPMTRAELYGSLHKLEALIDEYYEAKILDPNRLELISDRILQLVKQEHLSQELNISNLDTGYLDELLLKSDAYLCELKEAQIRDGLHILGQVPQDRQLRDLIISIARFPHFNRLGLIQALAEDFNLELNILTANPTDNFVTNDNLNYPLNPASNLPSLSAFDNCHNLGDVRAILEAIAAELIEQILHNQPLSFFGKETTKELEWIQTNLLPALQLTTQEITNLMRGLDGEYIPSGASGAPTRGRVEVLPTGRNFYSVDIRGIPTPTAWDVGRKAAEALIERYTQEHGEYPKTLAISIWGTSTMRTGGDDVAQIMALLGVRPIWDETSRRVIDFEILLPSALGRPRVDVTVRISGFFRDSFPNLVDLLYQIIDAVGNLNNEAPEINPLAAQVQQEQEFWSNQGLTKEEAKKRSLYRIFGSKPGAYGAGLQGLIESQNWETDEDLARAFINWSCYAYTREKAISAPEVFRQRLQQLEIILHNQDNREHDLLDSDDYYQFQGGLTVATRAIKGQNPELYFGDNSNPSNPKIKKLKEEIAKVYRSRVINPKWIAGVMRHSYKGAFEMSATVDYLFAYDATTNCVEDYMYQGVAEAYVFDESVRQFIGQYNPWALRDISERLLEAKQRGLWQNVSQTTLDKLRAIVHESEAIIEQI